MTLRTVLLSLQALLASAEPDDPQDAVVARQYKETPDVFKKTARHWAYIYAGGWFTLLLHFYVYSIIIHIYFLICLYICKIIQVYFTFNA